MPNYLAQFQIKALEYSFGGFRPYEDKKDYRFNTMDESGAKIMVKEEADRIKRELIGAVVNLESLLKIEEVSINYF